MPNFHHQTVVRSQGPEWTVQCDTSAFEQAQGHGPAGALGNGADAYLTVLQVLDLTPLSGDDIAGTVQAASREPPPPGRKQREYPHSSGDRNTWPPVRNPDKRNHTGGSQRVAPVDLPRPRPRRGGGA